MIDAASSDVARDRDELLEGIREAIRRLSVLRADLARDGLLRHCSRLDETVTQLRMYGRGKL